MAKYKESRIMRYWLLVILLNALFYLIVKHAAPEWHGTPGYYAGLIICTLIAGHHMA
jgi:hypothetical protein